MNFRLIFFLLLLPCCTNAQADKKSPLALGTFNTSLRTNNQSEHPLHPGFGRFRIIDARFDTSKLGYLFHGLSYKMIVMDDGVGKSIENFMTSHYGGAGENEFVIVIKSLWLQEIKAGEKYDVEEKNEKSIISECTAKLEAYSYANSQYKALCRIDTVFTINNSMKNIVTDLLMRPFEHCVSRISSMNLSQVISQRKSITREEVDRYNRFRFEKPRIAGDSMQRGIYLTYTDFLNNKPASYNFSLEEDDEADYLYIEEKGEKKLFTDFWGFCDGSHHFVRIGYNFFKLERDNNTYTFWGCQQAVHNSKARSENRVGRYALFGVLGEMHHNRLINLLRPMQLDMESGKAF